MSNIIKGNYIHYSQADRIVINSNSKTDNFNPLSLSKVEEDIEAEQQEEILEPIVEEEPIPDLEEVKQYAENILVEARTSAEEIIHSAKEEALEILNAAREQGKSEGYQSGLEAIEAKKAEMDSELEARKLSQDKEFERRVKQMEPQFAELTMQLVKKLTGIVVEDKKDLVIYLLSSALQPIRGPKQFLIRVSKEDAPIVTLKKEDLQNLLAEDCTLEIIEDPTLCKNQCFIETEDRLLDVSLDVQLKNLSEHLKMLANA